MAIILNIDTATDVASVCISNNTSCISIRENGSQKEHAAFVHTAILEVFDEARMSKTDIDAIAVTSGPGSYTGLRVAMATAKGLCYALAKPLITLNTLQVMARAASVSNEVVAEPGLLCPMIDARRMEVFSAIYDVGLKTVKEVSNIILSPDSFDVELNDGIVYFFGSGSNKFKDISKSDNSRFISVKSNACTMASLAEKAYEQGLFADVSSSAPEYFKEFYTVAK